MAQPKIWSFSQLGGPKKQIVLSGWSAPFGRPRHGAILNAGIEKRTSTTYYTGNSEPTVHSFGRMYPPWELDGRFMDQAYGATASNGAATVTQLRTVWNDFIDDEQIVRAQWGDILSYRIFITKMDLNMESENEIAWKLHAVALTDEAAVATVAIAAPSSPENDGQLLSDLYGKATLPFVTKPLGNLLNVLPQISDQLDDLVSQLNSPFGQVYGVLSEISDFESASTATLQKLGAGITTLNTGLITLRNSTDDMIEAIKTYQAPSLVGAGVIFSGASIAAMTTAKAVSDASISNMLLLMADLNVGIRKATRGTAKQAVQAQLGDSWENVATRIMGGPDGGRAMRLVNGARHGSAPFPGRKYLVPKSA